MAGQNDFTKMHCPKCAKTTTHKDVPIDGRWAMRCQECQNVTTTGGNNLKCGFGQYVKYKNVPNMEVCTDCPPGRFAKAKTSRNKECKKCPRGWIQPLSKQGRCIRCDSGKKANRERTACV